MELDRPSRAEAQGWGSPGNARAPARAGEALRGRGSQFAEMSGLHAGGAEKGCVGGQVVGTGRRGWRTRACVWWWAWLRIEVGAVVAGGTAGSDTGLADADIIGRGRLGRSTSQRQDVPRCQAQTQRWSGSSGAKRGRQR